MKTKFTFLILLLPIFIFAQATETASTQNKPFFLDADVGAFLHLSDGGDINVELSLNGGYLFGKQFGAGVEAKYFAKSGSYASHSAVGLGVFLKYEYKGFYIKPSLGKILFGSIGSDYAENERAEFKSASLYFSGTAGYRLNNGLLIGINIGHANRLAYDYYRTDDPYTSTKDPVKYRGILLDKFDTFCFVVGYSFPRP